MMRVRCAPALIECISVQIFQSMALGVSQLHECGIAHNGISPKYFKVTVLVLESSATSS